jgi:CarD family transcriptional regulator
MAKKTQKKPTATKNSAAPAAKKPAEKKTAAKPEAKKADVKKPDPRKPEPKKPATKASPVKQTAKPAQKPETKKSAPKAAAKPEAKKPAAKESTKAKPAKGAAASKGAKIDPKAAAKAAAPKKKLNVGQKPRSDKSSEAPRPLITTAPMREDETITASKPTPASKEAKQTFRVNDHVVYPAHGVGRIVGIEKQHIAGITNELFVIDFEQEKMKLRVPTAKAMMVGMRALADDALVKKAVDVLKGRARIKRTMWSRRAQEYEAKINSGDIIAVAEVVRDLYRATDQPEQSYSERQLFEAALDRLAREVAAVRKSDLAAAITELEGSLQQKKAA